MAKGKVPTRDELLAFIRDSETPVGKRESARAYGLKGDQRIELKELLRDLRDTGEIAPDRAKTFRHPEALTETAVLEIVTVDDDGHLLAVPRRHDRKRTVPPPHRGVSADITLGARPCRRRPRAGQPETPRQECLRGRIIRRLGGGPKKILGLYEEPQAGRARLVTPTDRKLRREFDVRPNDRNGALPGDIVWIEETGGALTRRAARGRAHRPDERSAHREPDLDRRKRHSGRVPEAALAEAEKAGAAPLGHRLDLRDVPLVTIDGEDARDSTMPSSQSRIRAMPAAGASWSRSPTSPGMCVTIARSTGPPTAAAPRSISPIASCRCCPSSCPNTGARWSRTRTRPPCWSPKCGSTAKAT